MHLRKTSAPDWKTSPWPYFVLALGWSWLFWIPVVLTGMDISVTPGIVLFIIGIFGPAVSAILLTCLSGDQQERQAYWSRLTSFKRIGSRWYALIILIAPVCSVLAILTGLVINGNLPAVDTAVKYVTHPLTIIPFAIVTMIYGPFPEELGWRGYALDRLQRKWNALISSLVLGVLWAVWHMPIFFMGGSLLSEVIPLWSTQFWVSMGPGILAIAVIMTWIYNNTQRSTLAAILFHFMMNFTLEFLRLPGDLKIYQFVWLTIIAIVVTLAYGPSTLKEKFRRHSVGI
jgi:membrane protease YdiL (CAAX protease family)